MEPKNLRRFIELSGDADRLMRQLDITGAEIENNLMESRPNKIVEIKSRFTKEFWNRHKEAINEGFFKDAEELLSENQLQEVVNFFETDAGRQYLKWKARIQSRDSRQYKANSEMHREIGVFMRELLDKPKDYKWKLS